MSTTFGFSNSKSDDPQISRVVLSDQIKEYIVNAILSGEYEPGDRVVESALARKLGVSQAPVREAIRDLVLLGFLESEPYKGTSVRSFTSDELWEVYTVRAALESLAARLAAQRMKEIDIESLETILEEMIEAAEAEDRDKLVLLDNAFHETILRISGNNLLYHLWKSLEFGRWTIVTYSVSEHDPAYLAVRHRQLLEALKTRDPRAATRAMQHHLEDLAKPPDDLNPEHSPSIKE
jgi:DNA-binding GntR family transcriptional regulator